MKSTKTPQIQKIKINNYQFVCILCSKIYRFESHLRTHFDKDHPNHKYEENHQKILFEPSVKSYPIDKEQAKSPRIIEKEWSFQLDPLTKFDGINLLKPEGKSMKNKLHEWSFKQYDHSKVEIKKRKKQKKSKIEIKDLID